jgi:hypothetical protein
MKQNEIVSSIFTVAFWLILYFLKYKNLVKNKYMEKKNYGKNLLHMNYNTKIKQKKNEEKTCECYKKHPV